MGRSGINQLETNMSGELFGEQCQSWPEHVKKDRYVRSGQKEFTVKYN